MLLNLKTEIARAKTSQAKIASAIGISEKAMSNKILERSDFTRLEMYAISELFPKADMKYLFASDKQEKGHTL